MSDEAEAKRIAAMVGPKFRANPKVRIEGKDDIMRRIFGTCVLRPDRIPEGKATVRVSDLFRDPIAWTPDDIASFHEWEDRRRRPFKPVLLGTPTDDDENWVRRRLLDDLPNEDPMCLTPPKRPDDTVPAVLAVAVVIAIVGGLVGFLLGAYLG